MQKQRIPGYQHRGLVTGPSRLDGERRAVFRLSSLLNTTDFAKEMRRYDFNRRTEHDTQPQQQEDVNASGLLTSRIGSR